MFSKVASQRGGANGSEWTAIFQRVESSPSGGGGVTQPDVLFGRSDVDVRQFVEVEMERLIEERLEGGVAGEGGAGEVDRGEVDVPVGSLGGHDGSDLRVRCGRQR
ncbi:hypothetical protein [Streptomyces sp. 2314.4]|uniref:hypothetical protein n=1 Tax=Streptomyces sp. 2314.4 TaxID=1881025 RepID=UPI00210B7930|nr:hypothetical protein [Streptomyces sp. 2314.4]